MDLRKWRQDRSHVDRIELVHSYLGTIRRNVIDPSEKLLIETN